MTMTVPVQSLASTLRGWFGAARKWVAANPLTRRPGRQFEARVPGRTAADATTRLTPTSSPTSGHGAESDSSDTLAATGIAPEDWDLLFRTALELLARLADEKAAPVGTGAGWQAPGTVLSECLDALDQLRRSVPPGR